MLLGPAGMGKTTAIRDRLVLAPHGVPLARVDLERLGREDLEDLLREEPEVRTWEAGGGELCLVLDSFDEPQHRREDFTQEFERLLHRWPVDRLWLRVACRSADWPTFLTDSLARAFPRGVSTWQLLPLTLDAIRQVAARAGVDDGAFITAVAQRRVGALAAAPMTLNLLLAAFKSSGELPGSTWDLYQQGLLSFAEERSPRRQYAASRDDSRPTARRSLDIASQVAAVNTFAGLPRLWTSTESTAPHGTLTSERFLDGVHGLPGISAVSRSELRHVLRSGLFHSHGDITGWTHATVGEHLAAAWVRALDDESVAELLLAGDGRLAPQTSRIAAWLVLADARRFSWLATADPAAFVGQLDIPDADVRAAVADALFQQVVAGDALRPWSADYRNLDHPGLSAQLAGFLEHPAVEARVLAVDVARQLQPPGLGDQLVKIAFDPTEPVHLRARATLAAGERNDADGLVEVLVRPPDEDDFGELVGAGILACWPRRISTRQALQHLSTTHPRVHIGGNLDTAARHIAGGLTQDDIEASAEFLLEADPGPQDGHLDVVVPAAFVLCANHLDVGRAAVACTTLLLKRLRAGLPAVPAEPDGTFPALADPRRLALFTICAAGPNDPVHMLMVPPSFGGLLGPEDRAWLLDQEHQVPVNDPRVFARFHVPDDAGSPRPPALTPPSAPRRTGLTAENRALLEAALDQCEGGLVDVFLDVSWLVSGRDVDPTSLGSHAADLSQRPRWRLLPKVHRERVLDAAEQYVGLGSCSASPQDSTAERRHGEEGVRALVTLTAQRPDALNRVTPEAWRRWGEPIVRWSWGPFGMNRIEKTSLIERAMPHARDVMEDALLAAVAAASVIGEQSFIDVEARLLWSDGLADRLLERLALGLPRVTHIDVARVLLTHVPLLVRPVLATQCAEGSPDTAVSSAIVLLRFDSLASDETINSLITDRPDVLRQAVISIGSLGPDTAPEVEPTVAANLIVWLMAQSGATNAGQLPRAWRQDDVFSEWAAALAAALRADASADAVAALERVVVTLPDSEYMRHELLLARSAHRTRTWVPVEPRTLMSLPHTHSLPLRSAADLRKATVMALREVQQRLSAGGARLLWDTYAGRPKEEEQISEYLADRLEDLLSARGVIVQPEAHLFRTRATGIGDRADIRLDATVQAGADQRETVSVLVEVKGAWNRDLLNGLQDQLAERYLGLVPGAHGVYVVVWPDPDDPMWKQTPKEDPRKRTVAQQERLGLVDELARKAQELSDAVRTIEVVTLDLSTRRPGRLLPRSANAAGSNPMAT
ncbi:NACHT domain-containing protein [Quadrisphaera oryzae]|uniref:NACHT domain-containing protein n=1 Tax=Quadrisphaera TaxID=317661 RepID=UPI001644DD28|nr:hypothetical protein [Quadrisphaera sp. RL12-1S]MBC3764171.1 hypothetical protein [Quadrisphaera sp. RL12-1S]